MASYRNLGVRYRVSRLRLSSAVTECESSCVVCVVMSSRRCVVSPVRAEPKHKTTPIDQTQKVDASLPHGMFKSIPSDYELSKIPQLGGMYLPSLIVAKTQKSHGGERGL